jgi:hypothetical protein
MMTTFEPYKEGAVLPRYDPIRRAWVFKNPISEPFVLDTDNSITINLNVRTRYAISEDIVPQQLFCHNATIDLVLQSYQVFVMVRDDISINSMVLTITNNTFPLYFCPNEDIISISLVKM